jgi:hypothetical protein
MKPENALGVGSRLNVEHDIYYLSINSPGACSRGFWLFFRNILGSKLPSPMLPLDYNNLRFNGS